MSESPISSFLGPGSQPGDEDGGKLDYMQMPSAMMTFAAPDLPEPEDTAGLAAAKAALAEVLARLQAYESDGAHNVVSLTGLDAADLALVNQVLGEGEVSVVGGAELQAQEAVLAGVWRVRGTDGERDAVVGEVRHAVHVELAEPGVGHHAAHDRVRGGPLPGRVLARGAPGPGHAPHQGPRVGREAGRVRRGAGPDHDTPRVVDHLADGVVHDQRPDNEVAVAP